MKVSFAERRAWLTVGQEVTERALIEAVRRAGPYRARVLEDK